MTDKPRRLCAVPRDLLGNALAAFFKGHEQAPMDIMEA